MAKAPHVEANGVCIYVSNGNTWKLIEEAHGADHKCHSFVPADVDAVNNPGAICTIPCVAKNSPLKKKARPKKKAKTGK